LANLFLAGPSPQTNICLTTAIPLPLAEDPDHEIVIGLSCG
jgi:hypothetical protein